MLPSLLVWSIAVGLSVYSHTAVADQVQIQLVGNVPPVFEADLIWEEVETARCETPCQVHAKRIKIKRSTDGMGLYNADIIAPATRLCLTGISGGTLILDSLLIKKNGRRFKTDKASRNIEANGRSGCSEPATTLDTAIIWQVNLE